MKVLMGEHTNDAAQGASTEVSPTEELDLPLWFEGRHMVCKPVVCVSEAKIWCCVLVLCSLLNSPRG
jgi:hypothetical protein